MIDALVPIFVVTATVALSWPLGRYMRWAMAPAAPGPRRAAYEARASRLFGSAELQDWKQYSYAMLAFNAVMFLWTFAVLSLQQYLPLNPAGMGPLEPSLVYNTVASFVANTNLQHYSGEAALSYFSQIFAIMWLQFVSAATGIAVLAAIARGLAGQVKLGNFFQDLHRATFLVLLPICTIWAIGYVLSGVPMTFSSAAVAQTLEGASQAIARGPVAGFLAIKQLGTNGGGFFGSNLSHPFENPNLWTNIASTMALIIIPMACVWFVGHVTNRMSHARVVFAVMLLGYAGLITASTNLETRSTAAFAEIAETGAMNFEGKELRLGAAAGATYAVTTTVTSNGSVNSMHDSLNPLTGLIPMIGLWLNSIFGGDGVGYANMLFYIIVAVFIAGLMVGRTPEYLTKKIEAKEMKLALIPLLMHPLCILGGTALFAVTPWGLDTLHNTGAHGLSEILYEFSSASANNGSGFEGLGDNTVPWNVATGTVMLLMRFIPMIAPLAIAGSLAAKKPSPETAGTFRTDTATFGLILVAVVAVIGALLFLPVAVLAPISEHLQMVAAQSTP